MRSRSVTIRVPQVLFDAGTELAKEEYGSFNEFMVGLLRYALAIHKPHTVTAAIAKLPRPEQDAIDDQIVSMFRSGQSHKGQWFERVVKDAARAVANGEDLPKDRLARALMKAMQDNQKSQADEHDKIPDLS